MKRPGRREEEQAPAERFSGVPPIHLDEEDERPSREDRDFGSTIFNRPPVPLPKFLRGGKRKPRS